MRMSCWAMVAIVSVLTASPDRVLAQDKTASEPTIVVRLRSVNDLLDRVELMGSWIGKEDEAKGVRAIVGAFSADGKGLEGVDPKRPFGAYATLTPDVADSPIVLMIPIADEARFWKMLKDRLTITPEKTDSGASKAFIPLLNEPVFLRMNKGYLYLSPREKAIDPKTAILPESFFAKDDGAVASVLVRFDKVPAEVKAFFLGQFELQVNQNRKKEEPNDTTSGRKIKALLTDAMVSNVKAVLEDGKEFSLKTFVNTKTEELSAEINLTAKEGSALARNIAGLTGRSSLPAGIVAAKNPVFTSSFRVGIADSQEKAFAEAMDDVIDAMIKNANPNDQEISKRLWDALAPTLRGGDLDAAFTLTGPDTKGHHGLLAATMVKEGKEIEKFIRDIAPFIPAELGEVSADFEKIGEFSLHKIVLAQVEPKFEQVFGTKTLWLASSADCFALSIEGDGEAIRTALKAKPAQIGLARANLAVAKFLPIANSDLKPDELKALLNDAFGKESPTGKDTISLTVEGGKKLTINLKVKGKALRLGTAMEQLKGK